MVLLRGSMHLIFYLFSLFVVVSHASEGFNKIEDASSFYNFGRVHLLISNPKVDPKFFGDLSQKNSTRIRKIPIEFFKATNIKEYSLAQAVEATKSSNELKTYEFKKYVNVYLYHSEENTKSLANIFWNRYTVLLTDDPQTLAALETSPSDPISNGFVYVGKKWTIHKSSIEEFRGKEIDKSLPVFKNYEDSKELKSLSVAEIYNNKIFYSTFKSGSLGVDFVSAQKIKQTLVVDKEYLNGGRWIDGHVIFREYDLRDHDCYTLYFFSMNEIKTAELECEFSYK